MNIFIGGIAGSVVEDDLRKKFEEFGEVSSATVIKDKFTGESRGFGFVQMDNEEEGRTAIDALDGVDFQGKTLTVNVARPRKDFKGRGGGDHRGRSSSGNRNYRQGRNR